MRISNWTSLLLVSPGMRYGTVPAKLVIARAFSRKYSSCCNRMKQSWTFSISNVLRLSIKQCSTGQAIQCYYCEKNETKNLDVQLVHDKVGNCAWFIFMIVVTTHYYCHHKLHNSLLCSCSHSAHIVVSMWGMVYIQLKQQG